MQTLNLSIEHKLNFNFLNQEEISTKEILLLNKLKQFGLNPSDWQLSEKQKNVYYIRNATDSSLEFLGVVKSSKYDWKFIQLNNI